MRSPEAPTNALRLAAARGISFETAHYEYDEEGGAVAAAAQLGVDPERVYKTLVASGDRSGVVVFSIPASCELDLKKAARASANKSIRLVAVRDLKILTGYVRGGCSPIGMKKPYPVYVEEMSQSQERIFVNGGRRGFQIELRPEDLLALVDGAYADLV